MIPDLVMVLRSYGLNGLKKKDSRRFACGLKRRNSKESLGKLGNLVKLVKSATDIYP